MRPVLLFVCCSMLVALPLAQVKTPGQPADETDWPLFRGDPMQTGVGKTTLPDKLEIRWKVDLKKTIESTAAIVKAVERDVDVVYVPRWLHLPAWLHGAVPPAFRTLAARFGDSG